MTSRRLFTTFHAPLLALALLAACSPAASTSTTETRQWTQTPITDIKSIAGTWEGVVVRPGQSRPGDDFIQVKIAENGAYEFVGFRTIGMLTGRGTFTVADGGIHAKSERADITGHLFGDAASGDRRLRIQVAGHDGRNSSVDLKRARAGAAR